MSAIAQVAGLAFLFSVGILLQILGCALYNNWWPMLTALMYILVPMPCLFFSGNDSYDFISMDRGDGWMDAAKFLTGFSAVGSIAIPAILHHAGLIALGSMVLEISAFLVLGLTVLLYYKIQKDNWA